MGETTSYFTNGTARCETAKVTPLCGRAVLAAAANVCRINDGLNSTL